MVKVAEIMKTDLIVADPETSVDNIARIMSNNKLGSVVISDLEGDKLVGIITWSRIIDLIAKNRNLKQTKATNVMTKNLVTASSSDSILAVAKKMVKHNYDRIPIVEDGKLSGIVSYKDILASTPELIEILSEKLKSTQSRPPGFGEKISGICENCGQYSSRLSNIDRRWFCEECSE